MKKEFSIYTFMFFGCLLIALVLCYLSYTEFKTGVAITKKEQMQKTLISYGYNPELADTIIKIPVNNHVVFCVNDLYNTKSDSVDSSKTFMFYTADGGTFKYNVYFQARRCFFEMDYRSQLAVLTNIHRACLLSFRKEYSYLKINDIIDSNLVAKHLITFNRDFCDSLITCIHKHINDKMGFDDWIPVGGFDLDRLGRITVIELVYTDVQDVFDKVFDNPQRHSNNQMHVTPALVTPLYPTLVTPLYPAIIH